MSADSRLGRFCKMVRRCRSCNSDALEQVIDFGEPYISDFVDEDTVGVRAPLLIVRCAACGLVQMAHDIDREILFGDRYWYRSGTNPTMVQALADVVDYVQREVHLEPWDAVLDIGANDGTLLSCYPRVQNRWAVEPSPVFLPDLWDLGVSIGQGYWPKAEADLHSPHSCKAITTIAGFYQSQDPNAYVAAIKEHLAPDGIWVLQLQDEDAILRTAAWDYFCHEHTCLWGMGALADLLTRHGLWISHIEPVPINGGSLRLTIRHGVPVEPQGYRIVLAIDPVSLWPRFAAHIDKNRLEIARFFRQLRQDHKVVLGVGASTKANTVLQYCGINRDDIPAIIDVNPEKIGRYTVGTRIPIIEEQGSWLYNADAHVALAWQFLEGLRARTPGIPFITLLPEARKYPALGSEGRLVPLDSEVVAGAGSPA